VEVFQFLRPFAELNNFNECLVIGIKVLLLHFSSPCLRNSV
jgi:hypothetical protein